MKMALSDWSPIAVSIAALIFVIFSFWWMHWRTGNLIVSSPYSYMASTINNDGLIVDLPLSFYNTGAAPIIVNNLYLRIAYQNTQISLFFNATRDSMGTKEEKIATQFIVNGRKTVMDIYSFQVRDKPITIDIGKWDCELFGKLNNQQYKVLSKFTLNVKYFDGKAITHLNLDEEYRGLVDRT